jgi:hypothetical protein
LRELPIPPRALFICKHRHIYGNKTGLSSGLYNSARFVVDMLNNVLGIKAKLVEVVDANDIDREVTKYKPTHVFIEALWVVPQKFEQLKRLHPKVKWTVRLHSEIPFMAMEGISMEWIFKYVKIENVFVGANSKRAQENLENQLHTHVPYLPNYYPIEFGNRHRMKKHSKHINIGCFGALRPLKNQLIQAMAAIEFAESINKQLRFHINFERVEGWSSDSILKNLRALFANNPQHELVEHHWELHENFIDLVKTMQIGMQESFSETFNIVTADFVNNNVPVVVSPEIEWVSSLFKASPNLVSSMVHKLKMAWYLSEFDLQDLNKIGLMRFDKKSILIWKEYFHQHHH